MSLWLPLCQSFDSTHTTRAPPTPPEHPPPRRPADLSHITYLGWICGTRSLRDAYLKRKFIARSALAAVSNRVRPLAPATWRRYKGTLLATFLLMPESITCVLAFACVWKCVRKIQVRSTTKIRSGAVR